MADEKKVTEEKKSNVFIRVAKEFQTFISRGNVLDMAVGVIIGGAFTSIVNSLVGDIFTPFLGMILAGVNFDSLGVTIPWGNRPYINFGSFLQAVISFLLTALCVFAIVKIMNVIKANAEKLAHKKKEEEEKAPEEPPKPDPQLVLLAEIRDALRNGSAEAEGAAEE